MVSYTNRQKKIYYLHTKAIRSGKTRFYFSTDKDNAYTGQIPDGHEIYEHPNAQVFLRKIPPKIITGLEIQTVKKALEKSANLPFIIDVKKNYISIFAAESKLDNLYTRLKALDPSQSSQPLLEDLLDYIERMRFILVDKKARIFQTQRYCYRSSIDDWIDIGASANLSELAKKYIVHIGKESYFRLF